MTTRVLTFVLAATVTLPVTAGAVERLSPEVLLPSHATTDASKPVLAYGKDVYFLVWQAGRNEQADIVGVRLDKSGKLLDPQPFVISKAKDCQERPRVAFGGGVFLVAWHDLRNGKDWDVYAARVAPDGKVLDPEGIAVAQGDRNQCEPGVCWDGSHFQLLWRDFRGEAKEIVAGPNRQPGTGYHIYGGRVSAAGERPDGDGVFMAKPPRPNVFGASSMGMAALVPVGEGKLLAGGRSTNDFCVWHIADGKPVGDPWLSLMKNMGGYDDLAFTTNGKTILMTWTSFRNGGGRSTGYDKSGMLLFGINETVQDANPMSLSSGLSAVEDGGSRVRHPASAWDGQRYVVAWDLPRRADSFAYEALFVRTFGSDGTPLSTDKLMVDDPASPACWPAVASDGAGTTVIAYERHPASGDIPIKIAFRLATTASQ
jgi:hypothetical protein